MMRIRIPILFFLPGIIFFPLFSFSQYGTCSVKNPVPHDGSTTLGPTYNNTACGLNYVAGSTLVETRYNGMSVVTPPNDGTGLPTTISISGLPACSNIDKAYLWYTVSYQSATALPSVVNFTNTVPVTSNFPATIIGTDQSKCWGEVGTAVYRADVTAGISGNGTYGIDITGLSNPDWEVDGVTLFIIYRDLNVAYQGSLIIWDGNITSVGGAPTQTISGFNACAASNNATAFQIVSDMQDNVNSNAHPSTLNGVTTNYPNNFWCWEQTNTSVTAGQTTALFGADGVGADCFTISMDGLYFQTTTCAVCTPTGLTTTVTSSMATCVSAGSATVMITGGVFPYTYSWSPGGQTTQTATGLASGNYTVTVTDSVGCVSTNTVSVLVTPPPVVNASNDQSVCPGSSASLNAAGGISYVWSPAAGLSNPNISNPVSSPSATTTYTVTGTDANGCTDTDTVKVSVYPLTPVNAGADVSFCIGGSTTLNAAGSGTYLWSSSSSLSCSTCANPIAAPTITTTYTLTLTDANTCTNTDTVQVVVNPLPVPNAGPKPGYICPGFMETLTATGGIIYNWSPSSSLSNPNISNPVASPSATTIYSVTVTDANGCVGNDTIKLLVAAEVPTFAGNDLSICIGQGTVLGGAPTSPNGTTYFWSPATGLNNATLANPTASPTVTSTYIVVTANDTCSGTDTVTVYVNSLPVVTAGSDATICMFNSTTLNAGGGTGYAWSPSTGLTNPSISNPAASPTQSTSYTVTVTDANGCSNNDSVLVFVNPLPPANAGADNSMCLGDSLLLNASGGIGYAWSPSTGLNNPNISNPQTNTTVSTTYTVTVTDQNGCVNIDSVIVSIWSLPVVVASADTAICTGGTASLSATGALSYVWSPGAGLNNPNISNPTSNPLVSTTYTVVGTDANGCRNSDSVIVSFSPMPLADFGYNLLLGCEGMKVQFLDSSINATAWNWDFGSGTSTLQNPVYVFPYQSSYTVTLIASLPPCSDTVMKSFTVDEFSKYITIETPNVFTPNDDGINDCFRLKMNGSFDGCAEFSIYDRWGVPVFHSAYSGTCWEGRTEAGVALPEGTYFYIFDVKGTQAKGYITLAR